MCYGRTASFVRLKFRMKGDLLGFVTQQLKKLEIFSDVQ